MKTLKRLGVMVLLVGVLIVGVAAVSAQPGSGNPGGRGRGNGGSQRFGGVAECVQEDGWRACVAGRPALRVRVGVLRLAAEQTGLTTREIARQINGGATLSTVLADNGFDVDAFAAEATERAEARLNLLVANDRITQEVADDLLAQFVERLDEALALTPAV